MSTAALRLRPGQAVEVSQTARVEPPPRLFNRSFVQLWQAQLVSQSGNQAFLIAMTFWTADTMHSATMSGLMLMAGVLPAIVLGPLAGAFVDGQRSRLRIIIACDLLSGVFASLLALGFLVGPGDWRPAMLFTVAMLIGVCNAFFDPAVTAFIPDLVPRDQIEAANAFAQSSRQVTGLCAQGLGGIVYALAGPPILILLDGVSFLFAGATEMLIRPPRTGVTPSAGNPGAPRPASGFFRYAADGIRYVAAQPGMVGFLTTASVFNALLMPMSVLLPVYATEHLHADVRWYGFLLAAISAGAVAASTSIGTTGQRMSGSSRRTLLIAALASLALTLAVLGQIRGRGFALALAFASGVLTGTVNVLVISIIQRRTPREFLGRVVGLHAMMTRALVPIGMVVGGALADLTGRNVPLVYGTCGTLALASAILLAARPTTRAFLACS